MTKSPAAGQPPGMPAGVTPGKARGDALTADLLADLEREAAPAELPHKQRSGGLPGASPSLQTTLRITPWSWRPPAVHRRTGGFSGSFGPIDVAVTVSARAR
jgi:hypothetical protein